MKTSDKNKQAIKTSDKLLNCPFCGGENIKYTYIDWVDAIRCYGCGAVMTAPMDFDGNRKEELKNKWNTHKPVERILEEIEEEIERQWGYYNNAKREGNIRQMDYSDGCAEGLTDAIKIVKKEGGIE